MKPGRRALFGGSFDPVHYGHLMVAELVRERNDLERVVFVPARQAPNKTRARASASDRLAMLRLALRGNPHLTWSDLELQRPLPSYTIDTIRFFADKWGEKPVLVLGGDALLELPTWREWESLRRECRLVVFARPGFEKAATRAQKLGARYHEDVQCSTSSRDVRRLVRRGSSIRYQVPEAVRRYIQQHGLYGARRSG